MKYYIVNETEAGLAVIANENGVLSLPSTDILPDNLIPNIGNGQTIVKIAEVGTLVFTDTLPPGTPHHRIDYNSFVSSSAYVDKASLLLRFSGNFIQ